MNLLPTSQVLVQPNPPLGEVVTLGAAVLVFVVLVHGIGLRYILRNYRRIAKRLLGHVRRPVWAGVLFGWTVLLMLILHLVDTCIWAGTVSWIGLISDFRDSLYVTANDYTTLGLASGQLGVGWRELNPIIAISGLFTFGWTTSVFFNVVGYDHDLTNELAEAWTTKMRTTEAAREDRNH